METEHVKYQKLGGLMGGKKLGESNKICSLEEKKDVREKDLRVNVS